MSVRDKALHILRTTGRAPAVLDGPEMPPESSRAWGWFLELHAGRPAGFGLSPLQWSEIHAFLALLGVHPLPWELRLIRVIDSAFLSVHATTTPEE